MTCLSVLRLPRRFLPLLLLLLLAVSGVDTGLACLLKCSTFASIVLALPAAAAAAAPLSVWRGHGPVLPDGPLPHPLQQPGIQPTGVRQRRQDIPRQVSGVSL
jgi:hypothetical protein